MNHDYAHCLDQTESCPKNCFRRQLNEDLKTMKDYGMGWISWMHFRKTGMCQIEEEEDEHKRTKNTM